MQSSKKIHVWAQMQVPLLNFHPWIHDLSVIGVKGLARLLECTGYALLVAMQ